MKYQTAYLPAIALLWAGYLSHISGLDLMIAKSIYADFGGFPRNAFFLKHVMHEAMRAVCISALSALALALLWDGVKPQAFLAPYRRPLRIFLAGAVVFIGGVAALKAFTTPACPWDLSLFGGDRGQTDYSDIFRTGLLGKGHCFPAGHSTSGYVWLGLAFVFGRDQRAFFRLIVLLLPIGLSLSAAQILRGAHFLSHELTTLGIGLLVFSMIPALFAGKSAKSSSGISHAHKI